MHVEHSIEKAVQFLNGFFECMSHTLRSFTPNHHRALRLGVRAVC